MQVSSTGCPDAHGGVRLALACEQQELPRPGPLFGQQLPGGRHPDNLGHLEEGKLMEREEKEEGAWSGHNQEGDSPSDPLVDEEETKRTPVHNRTHHKI